MFFIDDFTARRLLLEEKKNLSIGKGIGFFEWFATASFDYEDVGGPMINKK